MHIVQMLNKNRHATTHNGMMIRKTFRTEINNDKQHFTHIKEGRPDMAGRQRDASNTISCRHKFYYSSIQLFSTLAAAIISQIVSDCSESPASSPNLLYRAYADIVEAPNMRCLLFCSITNSAGIVGIIFGCC